MTSPKKKHYIIRFKDYEGDLGYYDCLLEYPKCDVSDALNSVSSKGWEVLDVYEVAHHWKEQKKLVLQEAL